MGQCRVQGLALLGFKGLGFRIRHVKGTVSD